MNEEKKHAGSIYLSDLAQQYFPDSTPRSAVSQLHRWIALNTELTRRLEELYYKPRQRALTPLQHEAVIDCLGEPGE
ncbi:DUF4248 domain-containing protein [uncultured Bacteroides sp.]|jgi:hypothetical protein|uniref:DUF4248 domain-containing protein n=1 Tax=uncultured Bacteroides sp. TaxID=162156 RepID=UPI0025F5D528|nr:DUF4248 domain-containing protein [uncultured Bacteroides sp.]